MAISMSTSARSAARPQARRPFAVAAPKLRRGALTVVASEKQGKGGEEGGKSFDRSVYGIVASNANYLILGACLDKAGLAPTLMGAGPFTMFAPNDDAFADAVKALGTTKLGLRDLPNLPEVLKNHVVAGSVLSSELKEGQEVEMLSGKKLKVTLAGGAKINGVPITKTDIKATNGIIHAVKGVLIPK